MKVAVLCSGGVDSSVALTLLRKQGVSVTAVYLKIWLEEDFDSLGDCPWQEDLEYLERTCKMLQVDLRIVPLQREYFERIVQEMFVDLQNGLTPNPDVLCNQRIKFAASWLENINGDFTHIASGHYARIEEERDRRVYLLKKSKDTVKDQTYFLSYLSQEQMQKIIFPLGDMTKSEVRKFARQERLPACERRDSQGLCFIGKINFRNFVAQNLGKKKGSIIDWDNQKTLGEHWGHWFYTIGQRSGLGLSGGPYFVVHRAMQENVVYVSRNPLTESLHPDRFRVVNMNWISGHAPRWLADKKSVLSLRVRIRHGENSIPCKIQIDSPEMATIKTRGSGDGYRVFLQEKDPGITSGQVAAFYDEEICLGGGMIVTDAKQVPKELRVG